jgi:signal transduction histidine kinase
MKMSLWRSTIFRLLLTFAVVLSASMAGLVYLNYWKSSTYTSRQADFNIDWQFAYFTALPQDQIAPQIQVHIRSETRRPINYYGLFSPAGEWLAGDILAIPSNLPLNGRGVWGQPELATNTIARPEYLRTKAMRLPNGDLLVVSSDVGEMSRLREYMLGGLAWSAAIVMLGGLGVGLRRVNGVRGVAKRIAQGDLDARLPVDGKDEIAWLSHIVNHMLEEVSRLMKEVKGACDGIAHDLRTPLIHIQSLLARIDTGRLEPGQAQLVSDASSEAGIVLQRFSAILRISEIEAMKRHSGFSDVAMHALCQHVGELYQPVAEARAITLTMELAPVPAIRADYPLMLEALVNLVDNAIKFTPPGGTVRLRVKACEDGPRITLTDSGPGIPDAERHAVFQRFYRSDTTRDVQGSGLGLSVVQAVMHLHDFGLRLSDAAPGLRIDIDCWSYSSTV